MGRENGFTLMELVLVLIIVGALSVVAVSKFNRDSFKAQTASTELVAAIRHAQEKSMTNTGAADYQIVINAGSYRVTQAGVDITHPVTGAAIYQSSWTGITLAPTGVVSFDGYGAPSLSGALAWAANQEVISVTVGSESSSVTIEQVTGFAR